MYACPYSAIPRRVNRSYEGRGRSELGYLHHLDPVDKQQRKINQVVHRHCYLSKFSCTDECFTLPYTNLSIRTNKKHLFTLNPLIQTNTNYSCKNNQPQPSRITPIRKPNQTYRAFSRKCHCEANDSLTYRSKWICAQGT